VFLVKVMPVQLELLTLVVVVVVVAQHQPMQTVVQLTFPLFPDQANHTAAVVAVVVMVLLEQAQPMRVMGQIVVQVEVQLPTLAVVVVVVQMLKGAVQAALG
jgi:hypothetical protein